MRKRKKGAVYGSEPILECSSAGDKRFSAFHARIKRRGNRSIEDIYQASKIFPDGTTGLHWRMAKGRKPVNVEEVRSLYSKLWDEYFEENPHLYEVIRDYNGFSDYFGKFGNACQAEEVMRIKTAKFG